MGLTISGVGLTTGVGLICGVKLIFSEVGLQYIDCLVVTVNCFLREFSLFFRVTSKFELALY